MVMHLHSLHSFMAPATIIRELRVGDHSFVNTAHKIGRISSPRLEGYQYVHRGLLGQELQSILFHEIDTGDYTLCSLCNSHLQSIMYTHVKIGYSLLQLTKHKTNINLYNCACVRVSPHRSHAFAMVHYDSIFINCY